MIALAEASLRPATPPDRLRLALDAAALAGNWRALDRLSGAARAGAAIKADGYGVGAVRAAHVLWQAGCRDLLVAHWHEAAELVPFIDPARISVLHGPLDDADVAWARANGVRPVINSLEQATRWLAAGGGPCDLMVDSGINRLGLAMADLGDERIGRLAVETLMSHLASAESAADPLNERQRQRWEEACRQIAHRDASLANSAGIMLGPRFHGALTRPGLALYGGVPCAGLSGLIRQVVRPEAAIIQIREISAGETVGYNATFTATRPMRVGVIALGYADGYLRCWSGGAGAMSAGDAVLPVLGRVSMDMTVIDLTHAATLREGDWVTAEYNLPDAAARTGLSQYELLTLLGTRFNRGQSVA